MTGGEAKPLEPQVQAKTETGANKTNLFIKEGYPMTLTSLNLKRLKNTEMAQFLTRFLDDLDRSGLRYSSDELFVSLVAKLRQETTTYKEAVKPIRVSNKSQLIREADERRQRAIQGLKESIRAHRYASTEPLRSAYTSLKLLLVHYQGGGRHNYEEQSILISKLLGKLTTSPNKEEVASLGVKPFVDQLNIAQQEFEALFASRSKEQIDRQAYDLTALRQQVLEAYRLVVDYIDLMSRAKTLKLYKDLLVVANNSRHYYADLLAKRHHKTSKLPQDQATA